MEKYYSFNKEEFRKLIGKRISGVFFQEDFRYNRGSTSTFNPYYNRFEGIQNLVIWYFKDENHNSIKLYCVDNGRFRTVDNSKQDKESYYGVKSIATKNNQDLRFGKRGSISLKNPTGFSVEANMIIRKIFFYQEIHGNLKENNPIEIYPKFETEGLLPDRLILEGDDMFLIIRAEEDYDQNLFLKLNVGFLNKVKDDYKTKFTEPDSYECILIDQIE